jgi:hypothetical protein
MKPDKVLSPRNYWRLVDVIWDGPKKGTYWSMAVGYWNDGEERPVLAQRWDGLPAESNGMPISTTYAVWFVVPDETYPVLVKSPFIPAEKLPLVLSILKPTLDQQARLEAAAARGEGPGYVVHEAVRQAYGHAEQEATA